MGRPTIEPHDVLVDKDGNVWYSDFGELFISKFDPKTLKLTEYPIKKFKPDAPVGQLSLEFDKEGKLWFDTMYQGSLGNLDPKTGEINYYPLAPEWNDNRVQLNFVGLRHDVDGKVWTKSVGTQDIFRLDLASGKWEKFHPTDALPPGRHYGIYQVISDSQNNLWMAEFDDGHLGKIDAKTLQVTWYTPPTPHARCGGMEIDDQDRITDHRISRQQGRDVRYQDREVHRIPSAAVHVPVPRAVRQERRTLGLDHEHRPRGAARSEDRHRRRISDAERHQYAHGVRSTIRRRR